MAEDAYKLQGQNGGVVLTDGESWTMATTGPLKGIPLRWVTIMQDTSLLAYTGNLLGGDTKLVGETLIAGLPIPGQTTNIEVQTGLIIGSY